MPLSGLVYSAGSRPEGSTNVEAEVEKHLTLRMQQFIPSDFDLTDYDKEQFEKVLDLEIMTISLVQEKEVDPENPETSFYTREVTREANEEGSFARLHKELSRIA